jgi:hypothetical protein
MFFSVFHEKIVAFLDRLIDQKIVGGEDAVAALIAQIQ